MRGAAIFEGQSIDPHREKKRVDVNVADRCFAVKSLRQLLGQNGFQDRRQDEKAEQSIDADAGQCPQAESEDKRESSGCGARRRHVLSIGEAMTVLSRRQGEKECVLAHSRVGRVRRGALEDAAIRGFVA